MTAARAAHPDQRLAWLLGLAFVWSLLLLVFAATVPIASEQSSSSSSSSSAAASNPNQTPDPEPAIVSSMSGPFRPEPRHSVVHVGGVAALGVVAIPLAGCVAVALLMRGRRRWSQALAWTISIGLVLAAIVGFLTIVVGIVVLPTGALLFGACAVRQDQLRAGWRYA
jgi:hypothetical protein